MSSLGFGALLVIFLVAAAATWIAGLYLSRATDVLDDRFHLGDALGGMLLLGLAGSLPELAITASAAIRGDLALATGNLLAESRCRRSCWSCSTRPPGGRSRCRPSSATPGPWTKPGS